jgi:hypothetical protein
VVFADGAPLHEHATVRIHQADRNRAVALAEPMGRELGGEPHFPIPFVDRDDELFVFTHCSRQLGGRRRDSAPRAHWATRF